MISSFIAPCHLTPKEQLYYTLQHCLNLVMVWISTNKLKLNPDKMEMLLVSRKSGLVSRISFVLEGILVPQQVASIAWDCVQAIPVAEFAFAQLCLMCQPQYFLNWPDLVTDIHALSTSLLEYCTVLRFSWRRSRIFSWSYILQLDPKLLYHVKIIRSWARPALAASCLPGQIQGVGFNFWSIKCLGFWLMYA